MSNDIKIEEIDKLCKEHPEYLDIYPVLSLIVLKAKSVSPKVLNKIIEVLEEVRSIGKLEYIDEKLINYFCYGQELTEIKDIMDLISLLLPERVKEEHLNIYLGKFGLFWDSEIKYNGINNFKKLEENGMKYSDKWSKCPILPFMLCAYFYANLEMFNYDYDSLIDMLNNYFSNYEEYIAIYRLSFEDGSSFVNAYRYIDIIIQDLITNHKNKHI